MATGKLYRRGEAWYLYICTGRKIDSQYERIRRRAQGVTRAEAQVELEEELYRIGRAARVGGPLDNDYLLRMLANGWLESVGLGVSRRSFLNYQSVIRRIVDWLDAHGVQKASQVNHDVLEAFLKDQKQRGEFSHRIINLSVEKLNSAFEWGVSRGYLLSNLMKGVRRLPKKRVKLRRDLSREEAQALLRQATATFRPIWFFMLCTGVRRDEMAEARVGDIDLERKQFMVREKAEWKPKTEAGARIIPLSDQLLAVLKPLLKGRRGGEYLFQVQSGQKRNNNVWRVFQTHMRNALYELRGIPTRKNLKQDERKRFEAAIEEVQEELKRLDVHSLRYTWITELISSGVDPKTVQTLAGHKSIETTLGIYAQCRERNAVSAVKALPWDYASVATDLPQAKSKS